ncbi:MAG: bifunctional tetrahydrofolate synthase/dihydrofolate synthase [Pseudomonadales bacterium]|jgi:dihydrofolate synthase/folylpolyglutamate synthase|nr:bifunctional tetrahydrofolate synthase/dihydrofolate synthase [Pseudomonadales bacterium]MDP7358493.1 bifunctional tetrahydrofolate synthase/dihydrofolate synthase [Pseudomonadales bacterium]MDP7595080.1 bifunctional tetrahydrofolate synthase/dihydrofolate synthase [Pseudomonadales bacterium]HJN51282.1 bifunctional tetrahydrofolate synthase/dihydrofolate synthase [Pseudomonadales bacterium]|tara:strand:+ start:4200 stop:5462 length:1263 start_codon:yes stop_codon:yes gene_type:complete
MPAKTLDAWLSWMEELHPKKWDLGLERVKAVATRLDLLSRDGTLFLVAGTNGKGSAVALIEAIARNSGFRTGTATSPHIVRFNERIAVNDEAVADEVICDSLQRIDQARGDISLTYFEFGTLAALDIFKQLALDVVVLEVGLGGRLDAMNIVEPDVSVVTTIDLDHQDWLGEDREQIGREKAGIFRRSRPAVVGDLNVPQSVETVAATVGARLVVRDKQFGCRRSEDSWDFWGLDTNSGKVMLNDLPYPHLHLDNAIVAIQAWVQSRLPLNADSVRASLAGTRLPGRYQLIEGDIPVILDVAHNPQAVAYLTERLASCPIEGSTHAVVAMYADKDCAAILSTLDKVVDYWYLAGMAEARGESADGLKARLSVGDRSGIKTYDRVGTAYRDVMMNASKGDRVVVSGSFVAVAEALEAMGAT